jgi:hypothetical protein
VPIDVACTAEGDGHRCQVEVTDAQSTSRHLVRVSRSDIDQWARGRSVERLVQDSFDFLLQRESKDSILQEFDLSVIKRYFPEFDGG